MYRIIVGVSRHISLCGRFLSNNCPPQIFLFFFFSKKNRKNRKYFFQTLEIYQRAKYLERLRNIPIFGGGGEGKSKKKRRFAKKASKKTQYVEIKDKKAFGKDGPFTILLWSTVEAKLVLSCLSVPPHSGAHNLRTRFSKRFLDRNVRTGWACVVTTG